MKTLETDTINMIDGELKSIPEKYQKNFNSIHEGYAVILEEVRELEQEVFFGEKKAKADYMKPEYPIDKQVEHEKQFHNGYVILHRQRMREECVQIAAMCARFIQELT